MGSTPQEVQARGRYELGDLIGRGGMGEVYAGCATGAHGFSKPVAIKRLLPEIANDRVYVERLIAEAKLLVNIQHGNIVSVLDLVRDREDVFLVMEFVDGPSLAQLLKTHRKMSLGVSTYIVQSAAAGLEYAHARPTGAIIHADISPSNLLLTTAGEVRVADFGIARREGVSHGTGVVEGKWAYMAPEQANGEMLTPQADVFALGVVLYQLLTGRHPFQAGINAGTTKGVYLVPPNTVDPSIPVGLAHVCMRALAPEPRDRFRRMQDLIDALVDQRFANAWREGAPDLARLIAEAPSKLPENTQFTRKPLTIMSQSLIGSERKRRISDDLAQLRAPSENSATTVFVAPDEPKAPIQQPFPTLAGVVVAPELQLSVPSLHRSSVPNLQRSSVPNLQRSSVPDLQRSSAPDMQRSSVPDMLRPGLPDFQRASAANLARSSAPPGMIGMQPAIVATPARASMSSFYGGELVYATTRRASTKRRTALIVGSAAVIGVVAAFAIARYRDGTATAANETEPVAAANTVKMSEPLAATAAGPTTASGSPSSANPPGDPATPGAAGATPAQPGAAGATPEPAGSGSTIAQTIKEKRATHKTATKSKRKSIASRPDPDEPEPVAPKPAPAPPVDESGDEADQDAVLKIRTIPEVEAKITIDNRDTTMHGQVPGGKFTLRPGRYHVMLSNARAGVWVDCGKQRVEGGKVTVIVADVRAGTCRIDR